MKLVSALALLFASAGLWACSSTPATPGDDASPDAGQAAEDARIADSGAADTGVEPPDAGAPDSGPPDSGRTYAEAVTAATWMELPNAPMLAQGKQDDIYFTSRTRGFAVSGPTNRVMATDDGGDTWREVFSHRGTYFRSVLFLDDQHGFASNLGPIRGSGITDPTIMYETKDGAQTWTKVSTSAISGPLPPGICNQTKIDASNTIAVGRVSGPSYLLQSSDAGASWTSIDLNAQLQMLIDVRFTSPTEGFVIGGTAQNPMRCTILRTENGVDFTTVFTATVANTLCWKISFPSENVGYVSIQNAGNGEASFAKTSDGGRTWVQKKLRSTPYGSIGIGFITDEIGWVSGEDPGDPVYRTLDGGETWEVEPNLHAPINRFRFVDANTAYAIGGSIHKLTIDW